MASMRTAILAAATVIASFTAPATAADPVTFSSLLNELGDRRTMAQLPDPAYRCVQFSSHDRDSKTPDDPAGWFANNDVGNFLRSEDRQGRTEFVMADVSGPGAIVRIWSANPKGTLRIYLDGSDTPAVEGEMLKLLSANGPIDAPLAQSTARGYTLYLPIPFAKGCLVTADQGGFYYQVNVRRYAEGTPVTTFNAADLPASHDQLAALQRSLSSWPGDIDLVGRNRYSRRQHRVSLQPGVPVEFRIDRDTPGIVVRFELQTQLGADLASIVLSGTFDGVRTIECPLASFFSLGSPIDAAHQGHFDRCRAVRMVNDKIVVDSVWPMPYQTGCEFVLENRGTQALDGVVTLASVDTPWTERSMHFHATWRHDPTIAVKGGMGTADWTMVSVVGEGVYVGDSLEITNPVEAWWGEGDEKIFVDGESFPSHFGTGTEDYYGYAWCSNELFTHPLHSQTRCDGNARGNNWGRTTVCRLRGLDAIPFRSSLRFDMELWHWQACDMAYMGTTFFYARPGARVTSPTTAPVGDALRIATPTPLPPPLHIDGAIECEKLAYSTSGPHGAEGPPVAPQDVRSFGRGQWSGDTHLWIKSRGIGDLIELRIAPPPPGRYRATLHATRSWDYGVVTFELRDGHGVLAPATTIDLCGAADGGEIERCRPSGPIPLGVIDIRDGSAIRLRAEVTGKNPAARGTGAFFGLDCVVFEPVG